MSLYKITSLRIPLSTLVGIYEFLSTRGVEVRNLPYASAVSIFCTGMVEGAVKSGRIPAHLEEDLAVVLKGLRGSTEMSLDEDLPFETPTPVTTRPVEVTQLSVEAALQKVFGGQDDLDIEVTQKPDTTEVQDSTGPPWLYAQMLPPKDFRALIADRGHHIWLHYSHDEVVKDQLYALAMSNVFAQVEKDQWSESGTKSFQRYLHRRYLDHILEHPEDKPPSPL